MHKNCYCFTPESYDVFTQTFRVIAIAINKDKAKIPRRSHSEKA